MNGFNKFKNFQPLVEVYIDKYSEQLNNTFLSQQEFTEFIFLYVLEAYRLHPNDTDACSEYINNRIRDALHKYKKRGNYMFLDDQAFEAFRPLAWSYYKEYKDRKPEHLQDTQFQEMILRCVLGGWKLHRDNNILADKYVRNLIEEYIRGELNEN